MNAAFDVGADDGLHGILFAFANPKIKVFAFEPIKGSKKRIIKNLKKIEKFFQIKISNYEIINAAVSDYNGHTKFNESYYQVASSLLKPNNKLDKFWTKSKNLLTRTEIKNFKTKKTYKVKVITLEKFCKENSINIIHYLHIDAQGQDLKVIKGLNKYKNYLLKGVAEISKKNKFNLYKNEPSYKDLKKKFIKWRFDITNVEEVQKDAAYLNVYFQTTNTDLLINDAILFKYPKKRLIRLFKRIFLEKENFKDVLFKKYWKLRLNINKN